MLVQGVVSLLHAVLIPVECTFIRCAVLRPPTRPMVGGANEMEDVMNFNLNRNDLAIKSTAQLAALFQDASRAITASNGAIASAQSLLAMIAQELGRRDPAP